MSRGASGPGQADGDSARLAARITALEQELDERRRASERLAEILDLQPELICRLRSVPGVTGGSPVADDSPEPGDQSRGYVLTYANQSFCRYFERRPEELIGHPLDLGAPAEDHAFLLDHLAVLDAEEPVAVFEHRIRRTDGEQRWLLWRHRAIFDASGALTEIQAVGHDVTEERGLGDERAGAARSSSELEAPPPVSRTHPRSDEHDPLQELGRYASSVAHDFNNLLVGILGNSRLALMDLSTYSPCRQLIHEVENAAMRAAELANQMLLFTGRFVGEEQGEKTPIHREKHWQSQGNILVVDDEEMVRTLAKRVLHKVGFKVMTVEDGARAVEVFRAHANEIVAVLLDMTMPGLDGEQTFHELRRIRPDVRVLLSSGYDVKDAVNRLRDSGLAGFIHKPYLPEDLIAKLRAIVEPDATQ